MKEWAWCSNVADGEGCIDGLARREESWNEGQNSSSWSFRRAKEASDQREYCRTEGSMKAAILVNTGVKKAYGSLASINCGNEYKSKMFMVQ